MNCPRCAMSSDKTHNFKMKKKQLIKAGEVITFKRKKYLIQKISLDGELLFCTKEFGDLGSVWLKRNEIVCQH